MNSSAGVKQEEISSDIEIWHPKTYKFQLILKYDTWKGNIPIMFEIWAIPDPKTTIHFNWS